MSAWVVTLFFLYGHFYQWIRPSHIFFARHSILLPFFFVLMLVIPWTVWKSNRSLTNLVTYTNIILLFLTLYSAFPVVRGLIHYAEINMRKAKQQLTAEAAAQVPTPDVYLIIMDGYTRDDVLREYYDFDNSAFLNKLNSLGFVTIPCSMSNYRWTIQSVSSMLNFDYFNDIHGNYQISSMDYEELRDLIFNSRMRQELAERGYKMAAFDTGFPFSEINNADKYYRININQKELTHFENIFSKTTLILSIDGIKSRLGLLKPDEKIDMDDFEMSPQYFYTVKMNGFDSLDDVSTMASPKFVFAHLASTHGPFNLDENGKFLGPQKFSAKSYTQQMIYTNKRVMASIEKILRISKKPPVIMLYSDHGIRSGKLDGLKNFMAIYAPDSVKKRLYDTITPINANRIIFSEVFGEDMPLVQDYSFYTDEDWRSDLELIPNPCITQ
jgi:hypothetical protein